MKRHRGLFRTNAKNAKSRLSDGFWQGIKDKRKASTVISTHSGINQEEVLNYYITHLTRQAEGDTTEEAFYQKVRCAIIRDPHGSPLRCVLDREFMEKLADPDRERYVFDTSRKVQECIIRFEQEKQLEVLAN